VSIDERASAPTSTGIEHAGFLAVEPGARDEVSSGQTGNDAGNHLIGLDERTTLERRAEVLALFSAQHTFQLVEQRRAIRVGRADTRLEATERGMRGLRLLGR